MRLALRVVLAVLPLAGCDGGAEAPAFPAYTDVVRLGGDTTDLTASASSSGFSTPAANLSAPHLALHLEGDANFEQSFVPHGEPGRETVDGLGPVFNNSNCTACHQKDGRGTPPAVDETYTRLAQNESLLLALSVEPADFAGCTPDAGNDWCRPQPVPGFGRQLFHRGVLDARPDTAFAGMAEVYMRYETREISYADGTAVALRRPAFELRNPYDNPGEAPGVAPVSRLLQPDVKRSPRIGMPVFGLGLLEAIAEADIVALADPEDLDHDGISGKANRVFDPARAALDPAQPLALGRFGWKANHATLRDQASAALVNDMGITNRQFPQESIAGTPLHDSYLSRHPEDNGMDSAGAPEASDAFIDSVIFYVQSLHVPGRRHVNDPATRRGAQLFEAAGCTACHHPGFVTGEHPDGFAEFGQQSIWPFTDLLLHDMGEDLADGRSDFLADGREWRTRPLWGIGLTKTVNPLAGFLHDGRARSVEEAILWHDGEAETAREYFRGLSLAERNALLAFLDSL